MLNQLLSVASFPRARKTLIYAHPVPVSFLILKYYSHCFSPCELNQPISPISRENQAHKPVKHSGNVIRDRARRYLPWVVSYHITDFMWFLAGTAKHPMVSGSTLWIWKKKSAYFPPSFYVRRVMFDFSFSLHFTSKRNIAYL